MASVLPPKLTDDLCGERCPLLGSCIKWRMAPCEVAKLATIVNAWERDKTAIEFLSTVGRLVAKFRRASHG